MKHYTIEAGSLKIPENVQLPIIDVPYNGNGVKVWKPNDSDLESGVVSVLRRYATPKMVGGNHMFLVHDNPPRIHNPDKDKHSIYWLNRVQKDNPIVPWSDHSWDILSSDREFLMNADLQFSHLQENNSTLRIFHAFGFAKDSDKKKIAGRPIADRGIQSQYRGHVHLVDAVSSTDSRISWLQGTEIVRQQFLLPFFLNTAGEIAIEMQSTQLKNFGQKVIYSQTIGRDLNFDIQRTMFAFDSWEEALNSVRELYSLLLVSWLNSATIVADSSIEFAGEHIKLMQGCIPGFTLFRPSYQDKVLGGIDPSITWLVTPFNLPLPQMMLEPGVLFNRLQHA